MFNCFFYLLFAGSFLGLLGSNYYYYHDGNDKNKKEKDKNT